jgi:hypothetical protein
VSIVLRPFADKDALIVCRDLSRSGPLSGPGGVARAGSASLSDDYEEMSSDQAGSALLLSSRSQVV